MPASVHSSEEMLSAVLVQIIVIMLCARAAGSIATAVRQPRAVGEIVAGLLLGPSLFGAIFPQMSASLFDVETGEVMYVISQIGLVLLMFQIGADFEFRRLDEADLRRAVAFVAAASLIAPFAAGFVLGLLSAEALAPEIDPFVYSLFIAIALAITAVPIMGRILREYSLTRTDQGLIAISSAAINDVIGWVLLAMTVAATSSGLAAASTTLRLAVLLALVAAVWIYGAQAARMLITLFSRNGEALPPVLMAVVIAIVFAAGIITQSLGVFTLFGGFLAGLAFHRETAFVEAWRKHVGQFVMVFFLPVFFTYTGLRTNVLGLDNVTAWGWCAVFFFISIGSKILPVYVAARFAKRGSGESAMLAALMNTRALMELIVLNIGFGLGYIPQDVFTMLVIMAIGTTIMTGPAIERIHRWQGWPIRREPEA